MGSVYSIVFVTSLLSKREEKKYIYIYSFMLISMLLHLSEFWIYILQVKDFTGKFDLLTDQQLLEDELNFFMLELSFVKNM